MGVTDDMKDNADKAMEEYAAKQKAKAAEKKAEAQEADENE